MTVEKLALRRGEVEAQLGSGNHLAALCVRVLLHGSANPSNGLWQIGGSAEESGAGHGMTALDNGFVDLFSAL
jgi:hypothetical protein